MKAILAAAFAAIAVFCALNAGAAQFTLGAENAAGPWGLEDGTGAGNEVVVEAFKAAGEEVRLTVLPYARAKALTLEGELDGCFAMAWEPALEGRVVFAAAPLYSVRAVFFENSAAPIKTASIAEFPKDATLGVVTGYEYPEPVNALKQRGVRFQEATSEEINLRHLAAGRVSSVVLVLDALKSDGYILHKAQVQSRVRRAFEAGGQGSYVGFSTKSPRGLKAKEAFDRGYAIIRENGVYQAIITRWETILAREVGMVK